MPRTVLATYRPRPGREVALDAAVRRHWSVLREQQLVTERTPFVMRAADGSVIEVFEWRSPEAVAQAHHNPAVLALWAEFDAACEFLPVGELPKAQQLFSEFEAVAP